MVLCYAVSRPAWSVAAGTHQLGGNRRLGFCIRIASARSESYWIGRVASDSSDLDAAQPNEGRRAPKTRRPFWVALTALSSFDKTADMRSDQAFDLIAAASGVLALVALAYLAFLLVGGMF